MCIKKVVGASGMVNRLNLTVYVTLNQFYGVGIMKEVGMVVEGINALPAAMELSRRFNVEMPITFAVNDVISGRKTAKLAVRELMERDRRDENAGGYHLSSESALLDGRI